MAEVVAAGWAGIRPGGTPTCRTCGNRFPRPAVGDSTVLLELYKAKWNTKDELKEKGTKPKPAVRQPLAPKGQGKQIGSPPPPKDNPWTNKQVAELQQKLDEGEGNKGEDSALKSAKKEKDEQEQKLRDRVAKVKRWIKEADTQEDADRFQQDLEKAEQDLKGYKEQKDATKPWHQQAKEAEIAHKAAKQALETAQAKLAGTTSALEQLQKEQDEEAKKVEDLQQRCTEAEAKAKRLAAAGGPPAPSAPVPSSTQQSTTAECLQQVLAQLDKVLADQPPAEEVQTKIKATFNTVLANLQQQQQQHQQAQQADEGSKASGAEGAETAGQHEVPDDDVEMDDKECDQHMQDLLGKEALEGLAPEELAAKKTKFSRLVRTAALKAKKQSKKGT